MATCAGAVASARDPKVGESLSRPFTSAWEQIERGAPAIGRHPRLTGALVGAAALAG